MPSSATPSCSGPEATDLGGAACCWPVPSRCGEAFAPRGRASSSVAVSFLTVAAAAGGAPAAAGLPAGGEPRDPDALRRAAEAALGEAQGECSPRDRGGPALGPSPSPTMQDQFDGPETGFSGQTCIFEHYDFSLPSLFSFKNYYFHTRDTFQKLFENAFE